MRTVIKVFITFILLIATTLLNGQNMQFRYKPVPDGSGFRMDDLLKLKDSHSFSSTILYVLTTPL